MRTSTIAIAGTAAALILGTEVFQTIRSKRRRGSDLTTDERRMLLDSARAALDAAVAAFSVSGDDPHEFDRRDGRAKSSIRSFEDTLERLRPRLGALQSRSDTLAELLQESALALMAFAINRKNRGTPDAAQAQAEKADGRALQRLAEPIFAELAQALA